MQETLPLGTSIIHPDEHHYINCITVDPEFQNLIPTISAEEREYLERNIVDAGGVRDPLTLWLSSDNDWVILDGHNRFEICQRLKLPFPYYEVEFDTRDEAADWIDRNQLGRRNLSEDGRKILLGRIYNRAKKSEHDGGKGRKRSGGQTDRHSEKTAERIARENGVSEATVRRSGRLQAAAEKLDIERDITAGEIKAPDAEIVATAAALPDKPTPEQKKAAREGLKRRKKKSAPKAKSKPAASAPTTAVDAIKAEIRTAAEKAWQRLKDKFAFDEHGELRKVLMIILREEQKQVGK
jgi:hypothetical protein